ncbi:MAG: AI-2E family transporter [Rhodospirillaceae bacterium]|nr:AI-2E family transporter [Rhodospirillaceae bacterium]
MQLNFLNVCAALGILALTVYVLLIGQSFLQPLVVGVVLWYLIITLQQTIMGTRRFGLRIPYGAAMLLAVAGVVAGIWLLVALINSSVNELIASAPRYQDRFQQLVREGADLMGLPQENPIEALIGRISIPQLVSRIAFALTGLAGDLGLILIYTGFLLLEHRTFSRKLEAMSRSETQHTQVRGTFQEISHDIKTYVRIKTALGLITGLLVYALLKAIGLQLAEFWAVVTFISYFIPTVGAILSVLGPMLLLIIQFTDVALIASVSIAIIVIQSVMNNVVEPRIVGRSLNLSSLVIIVSLVFWGLVWGVLGMFLCVPFMVIINIVLSKFEATRPIAVLLSADGNIGTRQTVPPIED